MYPLRSSPPILDIPGSRFLGNIFIFKIWQGREESKYTYTHPAQNPGMPRGGPGPTREEIVAPRLDVEARMGSLGGAVEDKSDQQWRW